MPGANVRAYGAATAVPVHDLASAAQPTAAMRDADTHRRGGKVRTHIAMVTRMLGAHGDMPRDSAGRSDVRSETGGVELTGCDYRQT